ncbi:hypothetical protein [Fontivita pretiosa]|uniref:hypothetical protein n=1 Tax=Fontivita pretiosa TaxID=2989684 RepID=UPI003D1748F8
MRLLANSVTSASDGEPLAEEYTLAFWFLNGDADRSRGVNAADYAIIDASYSYQQQHGVPPEGWSWDDGDFDYSGSIDATDYAIIDNGYFVHLYEPTDFYVTALSSSSIRLAWDDVEGENTWRIQRSTDGANFVWYQDLPANTTTFDDTNLSQGTRYWYRVRGVGPGGFDTGASAKKAATTVLPAPNHVTAIAQSLPGSATIEWRDNATAESGFAIYRSLNGGAFEQIGTSAADATSFTAEGLLDTVQYTFRVRAFSQDTNSGYTPITPLSPPPPPGFNISALFEYDPPSGQDQRLTLTFTPGVEGLAKQDILIENHETDEVIDFDFLFTDGAEADVATLTFPYSGHPEGAILQNGNYQLRILGNTIATPGPDSVVYLEEFSYEFFFLNADGNHDRVVNTSDLNLISANWQQPGRSFSQGDFNYDGFVDSRDLYLLGIHWDLSLFAPFMFNAWGDSTSSVSLSWDPNEVEGETEWEVWFADSGTGAFTKVEPSLPANSSGTRYDGLPDGTPYSFKIRAKLSGDTYTPFSFLAEAPGGHAPAIASHSFSERNSTRPDRSDVAGSV